MSGEEAIGEKGGKTGEETQSQEDHLPSEVPQKLEESESSTNGATKEAKGDDSSKSGPATDAPKDTSGVDGNLPVSSHEQDREEQSSRRVQEAQKYNNRDRRGRGGQRGGRGGHRNNNRFDPSKQEKTDDPVAIRKQVEFYFSESNLLTDKFLFEKVEGHKNTPVPIDVIHSFKRMQHFQPREAIIEALKESHVLSVVEDDTALQRKEPLPKGLTGKSMDEVQKVHEDQSMAKSVYVKGFGEEESTTQFDIEAWFANYGLTNSVRLRRDPNKGFKGSVFVEFDTEATQQKFLSLDPHPKWKGKDLEIKSKKQYCDEKVEDINSGRIRRKSPEPHHKDRREKRPQHGSPAYNNKRHDYADGDDVRDWRERRNEEAGNGYRGNKQKAHGSSGRRDRGEQGERDTKDEDGLKEEEVVDKPDSTDVKETKPEPSAKNDLETKSTVPNDTSVPEPETLSADAGMNKDGTIKKRPREDDSVEDSQAPAKKVDIKGNGE